VSRIAKAKALAVLSWAVALALLVPFFFFNYGGRWLREVAEWWPLAHP
jgi:hypothetical protein